LPFTIPRKVTYSINLSPLTPYIMAYQREPCDTYFVESEDSTYQQPSMRDLIKMKVLQRREQMANELSRLASDLYIEDITKHMHQMEVNYHDLQIYFLC
jgi:hypothetical protein